MGTKPEDLSQNGMHVYNLTVQAKDDGSCCGATSTIIHKETATVLIGEIVAILGSSMNILSLL